jgi:Endonuclease-reverse transcriptase
VREVRLNIAKAVAKPIPLRAGRWSINPQSKGNFVFSFDGCIPFNMIMSYKHILLGPFHGSGLNTLLATDISAVMPTLVVGDFNTHSPSWFPPNIPRSYWAERIEEWAAENLLTLANNPDEVTRRGAEHEWDSIIDLA